MKIEFPSLKTSRCTPPPPSCWLITLSWANVCADGDVFMSHLPPGRAKFKFCSCLWVTEQRCNQLMSDASVRRFYLSSNQRVSKQPASSDTAGRWRRFHGRAGNETSFDLVALPCQHRPLTPCAPRHVHACSVSLGCIISMPRVSLWSLRNAIDYGAPWHPIDDLL